MKKGITTISDILSKEIFHWKGKLEPIGSSDVIGKNLANAIQAFDDFRTNYAFFFLSNLEKVKHPTDWFLFRIEQTLLEYWEPIKRAVDHHIQYPELVTLGTEQLEAYKKKLEITKDIPAILYFDKFPKALRLPFGPIFFIGIPLTDAYRGDWKAIPHELGHQVYWNSQFLIKDLSKIPYQKRSSRKLIAKPKESIFQDFIEESTTHSEWTPERIQEIKTSLGQWSEEIFAEVIGTKIAGKNFVNASWGKILNYIQKPEDAFSNDGEHPKPFLLPFIRQYTNDKSTDTKSYIEEAQTKITKNDSLDSLEINSLEALKIFIDKISDITLKPIIASGLNPFNQLRVEFPEDTIVKKLLEPLILEGGATWTCEGNKENGICQSICIEGTHNRPFWSDWIAYINGC